MTATARTKKAVGDSIDNITACLAFTDEEPASRKRSHQTHSQQGRRGRLSTTVTLLGEKKQDQYVNRSWNS